MNKLHAKTEKFNEEWHELNRQKREIEQKLSDLEGKPPYRFDLNSIVVDVFLTDDQPYVNIRRSRDLNSFITVSEGQLQDILGLISEMSEEV